MDFVAFREWLEQKGFTQRVVGNIICRAKRADNILPWNGGDTYLFYLEKEEKFTSLTVNVKSQLRRAIRLYSEFLTEKQ